jgi:hypothetical protein
MISGGGSSIVANARIATWDTRARTPSASFHGVSLQISEVHLHGVEPHSLEIFSFVDVDVEAG